MTSNTGPELTFGNDTTVGSTGTATDTAAQSDTRGEDARRVSRYMLIGGAVLTLISLVIMIIADDDATVRLRSSEFGTWGLLIPSLLGVVLGLYGMTYRKAYEAANAAKAFTAVSVLLVLFYVRMAYGVFA